ncbi:MAG: sigma 54-interacting transcriptional regulator [Acidobacteriota bacterium]
MVDSPHERLWHVAFEGDGGGLSIGDIANGARHAQRLTDQQRMAVLMQGVALLAHLDHAGLRLGDGTVDSAWGGATLADGIQLRVDDVRVGSAVDAPHTVALALLRLVFGAKDDNISSRGAARRAARELIGHWRQELYRISPDVLVTQVMDAAPFLWQPAFGPARRALAAEHRLGKSHLWVAGSGRGRGRFLKRTRDRQTLLALLASAEAQDIWDGFMPSLDPWQLYRQGRFRRATAVWRRRRGLRGSEAVAFARALMATGRSHQALDVMKRRRDTESLLTRFFIQMELGDRNAAKKTLHLLEDAELSERQLVQLAERAIRLYAARGDRTGDVRAWIAKVLAVQDEKARLGGLIVAASAAWDLGDLAAMGSYLTQARAALDHPDLAWRWHHAEGLRCYSGADGEGARRHVEKALLLSRRKLGKSEAARLWNDVGVMRLLDEDLAAAEKACGNVVRLMLALDGASRSTLALHNLASLKIRRGRLRGVEEALARSLAENRRHENPRAVVCDLELQARFELARGRPQAALQRCAAAADVDPTIARTEVFAALEGRARGWLGHRERAGVCLERAGSDGLRCLDPEERILAWALAGRFDDALREGEGSPWQPLFQSLAEERTPEAQAWAPLDAIEPLRAARFVHDIELLKPGLTPAPRARSAAEWLRRLGAPKMAEVIDRGSLKPWRAIREWAEASAGSERDASLFAEAGYSESRILMQTSAGEDVIVDGDGGPARLVLERPNATWTLEAPFVDEVQAALLAVVADGRARTFTPPQDAPQEPTRSRLGDGMVGEDPRLLKSLDKVDQLATSDLSILILGESGTGKELIARRVHRQSLRRSDPFLAVNCAAFSESLIQSELFGHARGAFTGADRDRAGIFEAARSGTVFLDEIGDLPPRVQGTLLRVLQEGEVRRVGESAPRKVNARVVAATHQGLESMVKDGTFRQDLYYRLKGAQVELPPLRERGHDVVLIARSIATKSRSGPLSAEAERALLAYRWPGNIRELVNTVEVGAALAAGGTIEQHHLELPAGRPQTLRCDYQFEVEAFQKKLLETALEQSGRNQSEAARRLGMTRQALSYLVRKFGL